tara:strand:- start:154 stop:726 length:573 start_codon:yes stop_codon:yes gene_type:complete
MASNLFTPEIPKNKEFSKISTVKYYSKILKANPEIHFTEALELSKEMINVFHSFMCYIVLKHLKEQLLIQEIHQEGHAFKVKFRNKRCPGYEKGIHGVSLSINAYDNDKIRERYNNMNYVVTFCLNDKDGKMLFDSNIGHSKIMTFNQGSFTETTKKIFSEIDRVGNYSHASQREIEISHLVDGCYSCSL